MTRLITTIVVVIFIAINLAIYIGGKIEMAMVYNAGEPFYTGQYRGLSIYSMTPSSNAKVPTCTPLW